MKRFAKTFIIALIIIVSPAMLKAQDYRNHENGFLFNVFEIENMEERVQLASALATSDIWLCNPTQNPGELFIRPNSYNSDIPIYAEFDYLRAILKEEYEEVSVLPKEEFGEIFNSWAHNISDDYYNFLISDYLDRANHCMNAEPFCTSDIYTFPSNNSGYSWSGPNYGCLGSSPTNKHSFWYYMRIGVAGNITIKIEAPFDVDFALWGPFSNETDPCPTQAGETGMLTANCTSCPNNTSNPNFYPSGNLHDCSFSAQSYEYAHVVNGQVGQYFILLITNYNGGSGNITFQKYAGDGETDCGILPPLVNNSGPYCAGQTIQLTANGQAGATYSWTGPGGWTSNLQNPTRTNCTVAMSGTYTCTITLGNQTNSATTEVVVYAQPVANAGPDQTIIYGATAQLSGSGGSGTFNYQWSPANMVTNPNSQNTQTVSLTADQTYTLTVTNPQGGCTSTDQVTIHISGSNMTVTPGPDESICEGGSTTIQANAGGGTGNFTYSWTPTTGLSNPNISNPVANPEQTTTYTCTVSDGMSTQSISVTVVVNMPEFEEETYYICPGDTYNWNGQSCSAEGYYVFNTTTAQGCDKTITLHLHHYPTFDETPINVAICSGETYVYNGNSYTVSGQYPNTLQTINGCDSIVRINLTVYDDNGITTTNQTICPSQVPWVYPADPSQTPLYAGTHTFHLQDIHGCDSTVVLNLTVSDYYQPDTQVEYKCYPYGGTPEYYWNVNGETYHVNVIVQDTLPYGDCEGIFTLDLRFMEVPEAVHIYDTACNTYTWYVDNQQIGIYTENTEDEYHIPLSPYPCTKDYYLHLTVNHESVDNVVSIDGSNPSTPVCDEYYYYNHLISEDTLSFDKNIDTILNGDTPEGCDYRVRLQIRNMHYTPTPTIRCADQNVEAPHYPITATEFNVNRYTYYASDPKSDDTWYNSECTWSISKDSWRIVPSNDNRSCTVYAMDYVEDTIWLTFKAVNLCGIDSASYWLKPSFYGIEETDAYPAAVSVIPNPNNGQMELRFENMEGKINVRVCNVSGTLVDSFEVQTAQAPYSHSYAMKRLSNGVYFFTFSDGKRAVTKKVVIIH